MVAFTIHPHASENASQPAWPAWWRTLVIALSVLSLCSCRGMTSPRTAKPNLQSPPAEARARSADLAAAEVAEPVNSRRKHTQFDVQQVSHCEPGNGGAGGRTLPPEAFTGSPHDGLGPDGRPFGFSQQPWAPPGIARPWPADEYIGDGGDARNTATVTEGWRVNGLDPEDTLAHYDTLDGRTLIAPSNHVKLYAPRFVAVRRVSMANGYDQGQFAVGASLRREAAAEQQGLPASAIMQPVAAHGEIGRKVPTAQQQDMPSLAVRKERFVAEAVNRYKPYEDFSVIRTGQFVEAEKAQLAVRVDAAIAWTRDQAAQVTINGRKAIAAVADRVAQITYSIDDRKTPRLRLLKVASTDTARPGEIVEFTLRFDNTGDDLIGNVTIVDSLTTRLEYVPQSESSSVKATFSTEENEAGSQVLRWEIAQPLKPGQGGILRFKCRVR